MIEILSIGDQIRIGRYRLHSRFDRAVNFRNDDSLIAVVDESIGAGPFNVVITPNAVSEITSFAADNNDLYLNGEPMPVKLDLYYNSQIELRGNISYDRFFANLITLKDFLITHSPDDSLIFLLGNDVYHGPGSGSVFERELRHRFKLGISLIDFGNIAAGLATIRGLGYGLTPSGDDYISGMMSALAVAGRLFASDFNELNSRIYNIARGDNFISNAFLYCCHKGWYTAKQKTLIEAILYGDEYAIIESAQALLTIGETSGADWGAGFVITLMKAHEIL